MDIPQTERYMAVSHVYILMDCDYELDEILAVFATQEAAEIAKKMYDDRNRMYGRTTKGAWISIVKQEVLDKTTISKGQGPQTPAVGAGPDPNNIPETGA